METTLIVNLSDIVALEAASTRVDNIDSNPDTSMKIKLITDKIIMNSNLQRVYDPLMFSVGTNPSVGGLFSETIFGTTTDERRRQYAYIDLHGTFFHPFVFDILKRLDGNFKYAAAGQFSWKIVDGKLQKVNKDSDDYNEDNTGLGWLVKHFYELDFQSNSSIIRNDRVKLIKSLSKDEIFISKWLVIPIVYRDVDFSNGKRSVPEINSLYGKLIQYSNGLEDSAFNFFNNTALYNIQVLLGDIRKFGQKSIEKKNGHFHKAILGKSIDRGSRDVISVPIMNHYETPAENPIDIFHTGVPLAKCLVLGYNFIMRYCLEFFSNNFRNIKEYPVYKLVDGQYKIVGSIPIENQLEVFNTKYIDKKIKRYMNSHGTRFETITIKAKDGTEIPIHFSGLLRPMSGSTAGNNIPNTIVNRPMTWTDLFYRAAMDTISDKYIYATRFPVTSYSSIFPTQCMPLSTLKTIPVEVDGHYYPNYPYIDVSLSTDKISTLFIDTLTMSCLFLDAIGGDFNKSCYTTIGVPIEVTL